MSVSPARATLRGPHDRFSGDVYITPITSPQAPAYLSAGIVRFAPGAHTNWHVHPRGQTLHVLDGIALVGMRDGALVAARAGETVTCPAGVDHWHGAGPDMLMIHLALVVGSDDHDGTDWLEPLTDQQYAGFLARLNDRSSPTTAS